MRAVLLRLASAASLWSLAVACSSSSNHAATAGDSMPRWEGFVTGADSVDLFTRVVGSGGDTVIVLHGGPGLTLDYLAADLEPLAENNTLIFYDQRGAGRSSLVSDSTGLTADRFLDDLEAIRAHFAVARPTLLGHSWGVALAALFAQRHPDRVGKLILVDGVPLRLADLVSGFESMARKRDSAELAAMDRWMATRRAHPEDASACLEYYRLWFRPFFVDTTAMSRSRGDFCAGTPESRRNKMEAVDRYTMASLGDWDWREDMAEVPVRTLVVHGEADPIPLATAEEWAATMPNSRIVVLPGAGHFPYLEVPDPFFAAINTFLGGDWPASSRPGRAASMTRSAR